MYQTNTDMQEQLCNRQWYGILSVLLGYASYIDMYYALRHSFGKCAESDASEQFGCLDNLYRKER